MTQALTGPKPGFIVGKEAMRDFVLSSSGAQNANWTAGLFTIGNQAKGTHRTYIVRKKNKETPMWFVRYLGGDDNADPENYFYLGLIKGFEGPPQFVTYQGQPRRGGSGGQGIPVVLQ